MLTYNGKTALVTGASSGIGLIFARELAARGCSLILVARSEGKLHALADELRSQHAILVDVIIADLMQEHAAQHVYTQVQELGRTVDILVNNAGFAAYGLFDRVDFAKQHGQAMLNVVAVVDLAHLFLAGMLRRGDGAIINVASVLGYVPTPGSAVYGASKAFVLHFSEALWQECRGRGVRVLALCPGPTKTEFFDVAQMPAPEAIMTSPAYVVQVALRALERDQAAVIAGKANNVLFGFMPRLLPRRVVLWAMGKGFMQPATEPQGAPVPTRHRPHLDRTAE
ncbi:MAG: SDR family oxidoreductase [Chloroflexaceae bacterium]|nr:SDR family oxidoreductase [Chloroflexaceae bacterium]